MAFAVVCGLFLLGLVVVTREDRARIERHKLALAEAKTVHHHYWGPWEDCPVHVPKTIMSGRIAEAHQVADQVRRWCDPPET